MNPTLRILLCGLLVSSTAWCTVASAQSGRSQVSGTLSSESVGKTSISDTTPPSPPPSVPPGGPYQRGPVVATRPDPMGQALAAPFGPWILLDGRFGEGIGWDDNYFHLRAFLPQHVDPGTSLLYTVIAGGATEDADGVLNVGAGFRYYVEGIDRIFGASAWFDLDGGHHNTYTRAGVSVESLGRYFDVIANGYFVLNSDADLVSQGITGDPFFDGNNIVFPFQQTFEAPYSGADLELGGLLPLLGRYGMYGYVGPYFLTSEESGFDDEWGFKARADINVSEDIDVGVNYSTDDTFGSNVWVSVAVEFPFKRQLKWFKPRPVRSRLSSTVYRQDRIPVEQQRIESTILATNPVDSQPFFVIHVDPNATSPGDGTFENPYMQLESARLDIATPGDPTDIIRVLPRADNTGTNLAMTAPLVLNDNMFLWSTTVNHTIVTQQGTFTFPGFTGAGPGPLISNANNTTGSSVVTLANNDEVSGFRISGANSTGTDFGDGINDIAGTITGFNINQNEFLDYRNAVVLTNAVGTVAGGNPGLFTDNVMTGTTGVSVSGFTLTNTSVATLDLAVSGNTATNNSDVGYGITADASTINMDDAIAAGTTFRGNTAIANGTGGRFIAQNAGTINIAFEDNTFDDNTAPNTGVSFLADDAGSTVAISSFTGNTITDSTAGNGVRLAASDGGLLTAEDFTGNTITGHGLSGIFMDSEGAGSIVDVLIGTSGGTVNTISGNGTTGTGYGIRGETTTGGTIRGSIVNNAITGNGGDAISFSANTGTLDFGNAGLGRFIAENTLAGNDGGGVMASGNAATMSFLVDDNIIGTTAGPNGGAGIDVSNIGGTLVLTATDNEITGATGAGIAYTQQQTTVGNLTITGNTIVSTADDANALTDFTGEGIFIRQIGGDIIAVGANTLTSAIIDDNVIGSLTTAGLGNASHGIRVDTSEDSIIMSMRIGDEGADNESGNIIARNGADGINFSRRGSAVVDNVRIVDNIVRLNGDDGMEISAANTTSDAIDISVEDNVVTDNLDDGFALAVRADAVLNIDIIDNRIDGNDGDGIQTFEQTNDATDRRGITGLWVTNTITNNNGDGINTDAALGDDVFGLGDLLVGLNGTDADGKTLGNLIDRNGLTGVHMTGPGSSTWTNNLIIRNGQLAAADPLEGTGFDIEGRTFKDVTLVDNVIRNNLRDGLEIGHDTTNGIITVTAVGNSIRDNGGRGVDILNRDDGFLDVTLDTNTIIGNGFEGVFVVNTSSPTQGQAGSIVDATELLADGEIDSNPFLHLDVINNTIQANGSGSDFIGTGLVILVGTAGGGYEYDQSGGFASDANADGTPGDLAAGIRANVIDNTFGGNFGVDVFVQSFVSTVDPPDTEGDWSQTDFAIDSYEGDPLARLDLVFTGNTGDSTIMTPDFLVESNSTLAFYDNAEATFKSRDAGQTDPGPFLEDNARRRNAQRLAARFTLPPATPAGTDGDFANPTPFLYAGIGMSTFRVEVDGGNPNDFDFGPDFAFDNDPFNDVNDANGAFLPGAVFGESPFGWTDADLIDFVP